MRIDERTLRTADGVAVLADMPAAVKGEAAAGGAFLRVAGGEEGRWKAAVGRPVGMGRFLACFRYEPWWMRPAVGTDWAAVPAETQVVFGEMGDGRVVVVVPLVEGDVRCAVEGGAGRELVVAGEGCGGRNGEGVVYVGVEERGEGVRGLCRRAAEVVARRMGVKLRREKSVPSFVDELGWSTWDAFYREVTAAKVRVGLTSFAAGGVRPGWVVLDDGWQSVEDLGVERGKRLMGFEANGKFGGDLSATVRMAKEQFGVRQFMVWHTLQGTWGGVDVERFAGDGVREVMRDFSPGVLRHWPEGNTKSWGRTAGLVGEPERFFEGYHAALAAQGVDGVKVDNQATLEGLAGGGRVEMYRRFQRAVEGSARRHFGGEMMHCMSCANDLLYGTELPVVRMSGDFMPREPGGRHVWTNAAVGLWFGEFVLPDWDMFQSGHEWGGFHAAARRVSGGPVYVSDKPGGHDFALLRGLVGADGKVRRCDGPGVVARECLFRDVVREEVLLKVWNTVGGGKEGVVGVFNCRSEGGAVRGVVRAEEVEDLGEGRYELVAERSGARGVGELEVELGVGEWEVVRILHL